MESRLHWQRDRRDISGHGKARRPSCHPIRRSNFHRSTLTRIWLPCGAPQVFPCLDFQSFATFSCRITYAMRRQILSVFDSISALCIRNFRRKTLLKLPWYIGRATWHPERKLVMQTTASSLGRRRLYVDCRRFFVGVGECSECASSDCSVDSADWIVKPCDRRTTRPAAPHQAMRRATLSTILSSPISIQNPSATRLRQPVLAHGQKSFSLQTSQ